MTYVYVLSCTMHTFHICSQRVLMTRGSEAHARKPEAKAQPPRRLLSWHRLQWFGLSQMKGLRKKSIHLWLMTMYFHIEPCPWFKNILCICSKEVPEGTSGGRGREKGRLSLRRAAEKDKDKTAKRKERKHTGARAVVLSALETSATALAGKQVV